MNARRRWMTRAAVLAAVTVATSACGSIRGERSVPVLEPPEINFVEEQPAVGAAVVEVSAGAVTIEPFQFAATDFETGAVVDGRDLYDRAPLMMEFTVPSCPVCHTEAPKLQFAAAENPDVTYVLVHSDGDDAEIQAFIDDYELSAPNIIHLIDRDLDLWTRFGVVAQPYYVLVNDAGGLSSSSGALGDHGLDRAAELLRSDQV